MSSWASNIAKYQYRKDLAIAKPGKVVNEFKTGSNSKEKTQSAATISAGGLWRLKKRREDGPGMEKTTIAYSQ
jgi:hypothetical protein